ncbi:DegT/DnrJ/EryC1/StrS aminotransferase family protein [Deltaproteobacteria bacterium]|nr:DegT/DnrJ/EryC1/StrS aminotransferase family protein [Deltaproteobacteria bacterium]
MLNTPFSSWPSYSNEEADAVRRVLLSNKVNYWTGREGQEFEKEYAAFADCEYAVAVANGTVALELALKAIGVGAGDEVIVTSRTFIASVSAIVIVGATPVFADVDRDSQNITADSILQVLTPKTKAIICVHLAGWPCEMDEIMTLSGSHNLYVLEDCAQAHGARYNGKSVGSFGHIAAWSFCQDKIMTTGGEGGMVTTSDKELWSKMWSYKDHGKSLEAVYGKKHPSGFRWLHESFGTNWRMTEVQAAIGRIQLKKMSSWHKSRTINATAIMETSHNLSGLRAPVPPDDIEHAWYKCYLFVVPERLKTGWNRDRIMNAIVDNGVPCYSGSCSEVYLEMAFDNTGWRPSERLPVVRELGETSLMFLVHPTLTVAETEHTCSVLREVLERATR